MPLSAFPYVTGVFAFGSGIGRIERHANLPYWKEARVTSLFIPTHIRFEMNSFGSDGSCPAGPNNIHWLLAGASGRGWRELHGDTASSMVLRCYPGEVWLGDKQLSTFTRGSGGVFAPVIIAAVGIEIIYRKNTGRTQGVVATPEPALRRDSTVSPTD